MSVLYHDIINRRLELKAEEELKNKKPDILKPLADSAKRKDWLQDPCTQQLLEILQTGYFENQRLLMVYALNGDSKSAQATSCASYMNIIERLVILIKEGKENK